MRRNAASGCGRSRPRRGRAGGRPAEPPLVAPVPCRVVWAVEGPDRTGFGYGTLEGHVESGEEGFQVERRGDDVYAVVRAYSRPAWRVARLAGPLLWAGQQVAARGYLRALHRAARART